MQVEVISIGDELLIGQTVNTNAAWMGEKLNQAGIRIKQVTTIADSKEDILSALEEASKRADIVLLTGGLGPTRDDITKHTLASYFNSPLVFNQQVLDNIKKLFFHSDREIDELNKSQAFVPEGCIPIENQYGTAPGMWFEKSNTIYVSMPGVPYEMKPMIENFVIPQIKKRFTLPAIVHRTVYTQGIPESVLAQKIELWEDNLPGYIKLAYLPGAGMVKLRLSGKGQSREKLNKEIDLEIEKLKELIPGEIIGGENESLAWVIGEYLRNKKLTLATAESCTGGSIAQMITSVPGSSDYFRGSVVAYANQVKMGILEVKEETLNRHGAVSLETVSEMARGVQQLLQTDYAIATSGIAGPGGGTEEKPVGTTCIALVTPNDIITKQYRFGTNRQRNITRTALTALNMLRKSLME